MKGSGKSDSLLASEYEGPLLFPQVPDRLLLSGLTDFEQGLGSQFDARDLERFLSEMEGADETAPETPEIPVAPPVVDFRMEGKGGSDRIVGGAGDDDLFGGRGRDRLEGGDGYDRLFGGKGSDTLKDDPLGGYFNGGRGVDTLDFSAFTGNIGVDLSAPAHAILTNLEITPGTAAGILNYTISGDLSRNAEKMENVIAGAGDDLLRGSRADNGLEGGAGNDRLEGLAGNDILQGGEGDDILLGGAGKDVLSGGAGKDSFYFGERSGRDEILDFNAGDDTLIFAKGMEPTTWVQALSNDGKVIGMKGFYDDGRSSVTLLGLTSMDGVKIGSEAAAEGPLPSLDLAFRDFDNFAHPLQAGSPFDVQQVLSQFG